MEITGITGISLAWWWVIVSIIIILVSYRLFMVWLIISVMVTLAGCATKLPDHINDCAIEPYTQMWETEADCKSAWNSRETRRYNRQALKAEKEYCTADVGYWDGRACRAWGTML